jgi:protein subunit release factor B
MPVAITIVVVEHRPNGRPTTIEKKKSKEKKKKKRRLLVHFKAMRQEKNEKKEAERWGKKEEGCTYTNAIERVTRE